MCWNFLIKRQSIVCWKFFRKKLFDPLPLPFSAEIRNTHAHSDKAIAAQTQPPRLHPSFTHGAPQKRVRDGHTEPRRTRFPQLVSCSEHQRPAGPTSRPPEEEGPSVFLGLVCPTFLTSPSWGFVCFKIIDRPCYSTQSVLRERVLEVVCM